jgi:hypothetical protein
LHRVSVRLANREAQMQSAAKLLARTPPLSLVPLDNECSPLSDEVLLEMQPAPSPDASAILLTTIFGVIVGGFGVLVTFLVGRQQHELQTQRDREEWFRSFRSMQADFWTSDDDVATARRMIANRADYELLREALLRRNANYAVQDVATVTRVDCSVTSTDYKLLDGLDRLLAILVRMDDARQTGITNAQQRTWHRMHCEYWLHIIGDGRRPELLNYCKECWPDLAKSSLDLVKKAREGDK